MEIFGSVIWVIIATSAALIYNNASKRKAAKKAGEAQGMPAEAWPTTSMPLPQRQEKRPQPDNETARTASYGARTTSQPRPGNAPHSAPQTSHPAPSAASTPEQCPVEGFGHSENREIHSRTLSREESGHSEKSEMPSPTLSGEEFDLRQAIVLSEILHPKFDE